MDFPLASLLPVQGYGPCFGLDDVKNGRPVERGGEETAGTDQAAGRSGGLGK